MSLDEPPVKLCCFTRHWDVQCPDGMVMCCICFSRFSIDELGVDDDGMNVDVCQVCWDNEKEMEKRLNGNAR